MPTHCGVANESFRSLARGHMIRVCQICILTTHSIFEEHTMMPHTEAWFYASPEGAI